MKQTGIESDRDEDGGIDRVLWRTHSEGVPFVDNDHSSEKDGDREPLVALRSDRTSEPKRPTNGLVSDQAERIAVVGGVRGE